jgi:hypothetical protein
MSHHHFSPNSSWVLVSEGGLVKSGGSEDKMSQCPHPPWEHCGPHPVKGWTVSQVMASWGLPQNATRLISRRLLQVVYMLRDHSWLHLSSPTESVSTKIYKNATVLLTPNSPSQQKGQNPPLREWQWATDFVGSLSLRAVFLSSLINLIWVLTCHLVSQSHWPILCLVNARTFTTSLQQYVIKKSYSSNSLNLVFQSLFSIQTMAHCSFLELWFKKHLAKEGHYRF